MIEFLKQLFHWKSEEDYSDPWDSDKPFDFDAPYKCVLPATVIGPIISSRANQYGQTVVVDGDVPDDLFYCASSPPSEYLMLLSYVRRKGPCVELVEGGIVSRSKRTIKGRKMTVAKLHISERFEQPIRVEV